MRRHGTHLGVRPHLFVVAVVAAVVVGGACSSDGGGPPDDPAAGRKATSTTVEDRADEPIETTTVFRSGEGGYSTFRIPAVVRAGNGSLLAFAEARAASAADDGNVDLVAKRSTDGGHTWGELQVIADFGADFIGNPSPVLDERSGRLVLLATSKHAADKEFQIRAGTGVGTSLEYLLTSDDDGTTWSQPTDITTSAGSPRSAARWPEMVFGCGNHP